MNTTRRLGAGLLALGAFALSCHEGPANPEDSGYTVLQVEDLPAAPGSEWVYSVGYYDGFTDPYQRLLVGTDVLHLTAEAADSSAELGRGTAWVFTDSGGPDTVYSYRRGNRVSIVVPATGDTIPVDFPLKLGNSIYGKRYWLTVDGQDGSGRWLFVGFRHSALGRDLSFMLYKGLGIYAMHRYSPYFDGVERDYLLEDYAIGGGPHRRPFSGTAGPVPGP